MTYFAFPGGWGVYDLNGIDEKELALTGAHGYATEAEAEAHVNASPSPDQEALLQTLKASSVSPVGAGVTGDLSTPSSTGGVGGALSNLAGNITGGITGFHGSNFVIRAVKIIVGGMLVLIGLAHLTGADNAVANAARKVPVII